MILTWNYRKLARRIAITNEVPVTAYLRSPGIAKPLKPLSYMRRYTPTKSLRLDKSGPDRLGCFWRKSNLASDVLFLKPSQTLPKPDQFIRDNAVFFFGSLAVSALNYLYYPVLGRLLGPADFGETQVMVSLFLQATVFLSVVTTVAVNVIANRREAERANRTVFEIERITLFGTFLLLLVGAACTPALQRFLHFQTPGPFAVLGLTVAVSVPLTLRGAYLRGVQAFALLSWSGVIGSSVKILISAALAYLGFRTLGAVTGIAVAQVAALAYTARAANRLGFEKPNGFRWLDLPDLAVLKPHAAYALLILIVSSVSTSWLSLDTLAVKHYFSAETAGLYAGVSTISKIIFYVAGSVGTVLLSKVRLEALPEENRRLLWRSAGLTALIAGGTGLLLSLFPTAFLRLLLGSRYLSAASLLPSLCALSFVLALLSLFLNYHLALRRWGAAWISLGGGLAALGAIATFHGQPSGIIEDLLATGILMLLALGAWRAVASRYTKASHA